MSDDSHNERLLELLTQLYSNIVLYVREDMLPVAEKGFYSTRDYALGDTVSCTAEGALENCEQIRSYLVPEAPQSAVDSIEAVQAEIRRLQEKGSPFLRGKLWVLIIFAAIAFFIYFVLTHKNGP
jgi:hypothetical protein